MPGTPIPQIPSNAFYAVNRVTGEAFICWPAHYNEVMTPTRELDAPGFARVNLLGTSWMEAYKLETEYDVLSEAKVRNLVNVFRLPNPELSPAALLATVVPAPLAIDVAINATPSVTFNFVPARVEITVDGAELTPEDYTVAVSPTDEKVYNITFSGNLEKATTYTIHVYAEQTSTGRSMHLDVPFRTVNPEFTYTPSVLNNAEDVAIDANIDLVFTNNLAADPAPVYALTEGVNPIAVTVTVVEKTVTINPDAALTNATTYVLHFTVTDIYGQELDQTITFTTVAGA